MIHELLEPGQANGIPGRHIAGILRCNLRVVTKAIEEERKAGQPICASCSDSPGYFLATNAEELKDYCGRLEHREKEIRETRLALLRILERGLNNGNENKAGRKAAGDQ